MTRKIIRKKAQKTFTIKFFTLLKRSKLHSWIMLILLSSGLSFSAGYFLNTDKKLAPEANAQSALTPTEANLKVAYVGDSGTGSDAIAALKLVKSEGADLFVHAGDFDYGDNPTKWKDMIKANVGEDIPYLAVPGNHDTGKWSGAGGYQEYLTQRVKNTPGLTCTSSAPDATKPDANLGLKSLCKYKGLTVVLSSTGLIGSGHDAYIRDSLASDNAMWSSCIWHVNMKATQLGSKGDEAGWGPYEECRKGGAFITNGHEHSYGRTKTLTDMTNQIVDSTCPDPAKLCLAPNKSFTIYNGLGGSSYRSQSRCTPTTYPYGCKGEWAKIYTSTQGATASILFIEYNVNGQANKAHGYLKNIKGVVIDDFEITAGTTAGPTTSPTTNPTTTTTPNPSTTVGPTPNTSCASHVKGDADCDGDIELVDFSAFRDEFLAFRSGTLNIAMATANFNKDSSIDIGDFSLFRTGYLEARAEPSTSPTVSTTTAPTTTTIVPTGTGGPLPTGKVGATVETPGVATGGDAADDVAFWYNKANPSESRIIGTDKRAGIYLYNLKGEKKQYLAQGELNNVDIRDGFTLNGQNVSLVAVSNKTGDTIKVYIIGSDGLLVDVTGSVPKTPFLMYGSCMYKSKISGRFFVFVTADNKGGLEQWELKANGTKVDAVKITKTFSVSSQSEGCVADDDTGILYFAEETKGIYKIQAEPDKPGTYDPAKPFISPSAGQLKADIEGLTLVNKPDGKFLMASSQGDFTYTVYKITGDTFTFGRKFKIEANGTIDGTEDTDGIDAYYGNLGTAFPNGIFLAQDGVNSKSSTEPNSNQNFKIVPLEQILGK
jgi:myo-inositol-hexaphosphate 3-phosphohydrolase